MFEPWLNGHDIETSHASGKFVEACRTVASETTITEAVVADAAGLCKGVIPGWKLYIEH